MSAEIEQRRRTLRVLDLMTESFEAHARGDIERCAKALDEAVECDAQAYVVVQGAMLIGEIPNPDGDWPGWTEYVAAQREGLARAEAGQ